MAPKMTRTPLVFFRSGISDITTHHESPQFTTDVDAPPRMHGSHVFVSADNSLPLEGSLTWLMQPDRHDRRIV